MQARMHVTKRFGGRLNLRRMRRSGPSASGKGHDQHRIEVVEGLDLHDFPEAPQAGLERRDNAHEEEAEVKAAETASGALR